MEPTNTGGEAATQATESADAAAAAAGAQQDSAAPGAEQGGDDRPAKTSREDIYARMRERRQAEVAEDPERHAAVSALAGHTPAQVAEEQQGAGVEKSSQQGVALNSRTVTLKVEGQEIEVSEDEVREAGIRFLQKDRSADHKLQRASAAETLAAQRLAEADEARKKALENSGGLPSSGDRRDEAGSHPSAQDDGRGAEAIAVAGAEKARDELFESGDAEKAGKVILESTREAVVAETNRMFNTEFSDLASDPAAFQRAAVLMKAELAKNPSFARIPAIAARIGNQVRTDLLAGKLQANTDAQQQPAPTQQQQSGDDAPSSIDRTNRKIRLPAMPSRATAKTPDTASAAAPKRLTPSQIVHNMRVARGQARA